ncbi:MAG: hypothetical protein E6248_10135 [Clostridium sp.]|uniref:hypothetical protein n=1 Tax=Clostridium sp. TaxID=1506 RepID=UPI00290A9D96|nr:hypothetical protein [Clostridium sp.]MDU5110797.1 hypothetical protein [Clostridium sp.]
MSRKAITLLVTLTALIIIFILINIEFKSEVFNDLEDTTEVIYYNYDEELKEINKQVRESSEGFKKGEIYDLDSIEVLESDVLLAAVTEELVTKSSKTSTISTKLKSRAEVKGIKLNNKFSIKYSSLYSGPGAGEVLGNNKENGYLTHYIPIVYCSGDILKINYKVSRNGEFIRNEDVIVAVRKETSNYMIGAQSAEYLKVENLKGDKFNKFDNYTDYKENLLEAVDLEDYINF